MIGTSDQSCWLAETCKILLSTEHVRNQLTVIANVTSAVLSANIDVCHRHFWAVQ